MAAAWEHTPITPVLRRLSENCEFEVKLVYCLPGSRNMCSSLYRYVCTRQLVDAMHVFTELRAMSFPVFIVISDK